MNFLCHAMPYLDDPLLAVSTGVPDWLSVVDRRIRARGKLARQFVDSDDREIAACRHRRDPPHRRRSVVPRHASLCRNQLRLAVELRDLLPDDAGFRPTFVGHILIEMLLDAFWIRDDPPSGDDTMNR